MRILRVEAEGFGSFAEPFTQDIPEGLTLIYGENLDNPGADSNGSGKTTLTDMITWAVFGRTPANRKKDGVINHYRNEVRVKVYFSDMWVERTKSRSKGEVLTWAVNGMDSFSTDIGLCQQKLDEKLNFSFDMYCNSVFLGRASRTVKFLTATPSERLRIFSEMLDMSRYQAAADKVKDDLSDLEADMKSLTTHLRILQDEEAKIRKSLIEAQEQLSAGRKAADEGKKTATAKLRELKMRRAALVESVKDIPSRSMKDLQAEKLEAKKQYEKCKELYYEYKGRFEHTCELGEGDLCPTCLRELSEEDAISASNDRENLRGLVNSTYDQAQVLREEYEALDAEQENLRTFKQRQREVEYKLKDIDMETQLVKDSMLPPDVKRLTAIVEERRSRLEENQVLAKEKRKEAAGLKPKIETGKMLKRAFQSEVRNMLLDKVRKGLEYYTNLYLSLLSGGQFKVLYPNTSKLNKEKFEILLQNNGQEQDISGFSGGESWRAGFAVLLAIRSVLDEKNSNPFGFLIIDDPFGPLDNTGSKEFVELVSKLVSQGKLPQVLMALPRRSDIEGEASCITVVKKNRVTSII